MKIAGLQKLTLLDYPEKIACIVFTAGCNFRCPFCHNASLVLGGEHEDISEEEFFAFLQKRKGMLTGVCVTGGEPTLQPDLLPFLKKIKDMGYSVKLDTNGYRPEILKAAVEGGYVDYVAMDIKNAPEKYGVTVGIDNFNFAPIKESIDFLLQNKVDYEFRTTVVRELHTPQDIVVASKLISGTKRYFLQPFKDSGDLIAEGFSGYDEISMKNLLNLAKDSVKAVEIRG